MTDDTLWQISIYELLMFVLMFLIAQYYILYRFPSMQAQVTQFDQFHFFKIVSVNRSYWSVKFI